MAFTLMLTSLRRGAQRLGLRISEQQRADHHHLWRYVGYLMGVEGYVEAESLHDGHQTAAARLPQRAGSTQGVVEALSWAPRPPCEGLSSLLPLLIP